VADFTFGYFVGSLFEGVVVGIFAIDAYVAAKDDLSLVYRLGL
jgi:hypothetical protein